MKYRQAGERVTCTFNKDTGTVKLRSENGVLWPDWLEAAGIKRNEVKSIRVEKGTVQLPKDAGGVCETGGYNTFGGLYNAV